MAAATMEFALVLPDNWLMLDPAGERRIADEVDALLAQGALHDEAYSAHRGRIEKQLRAVVRSIRREPVAMAAVFISVMNEVPGHPDKLNASYADAAAGIRSYAASVRQIADDARVQQQIISNSTGDLHIAQAQQAAWTPPPHPATGTPDPAAKNPHDDQVAAANASIKKAQAQLHDLAGQRRTADGTLVSVLGRAHSEGMQNKHWCQKALDFVSEALSKITIVLMVLALVAIVVLAIVQPELIPGLLVLAGEALTALSAAQLAVDGARKASGEDVSWGSLAVDALGLLPGVGKLGKLADGIPLLSRGVEFLRGASSAVRGFGQAGVSFVQELGATRYVVTMATRADGAFMPVILRTTDRAGQLLGDARGATSKFADHEPQWLKNVRAGRAFNEQNYPRYPANEVRLDTARFSTPTGRGRRSSRASSRSCRTSRSRPARAISMRRSTSTHLVRRSLTRRATDASSLIWSANRSTVTRFSRCRCRITRYRRRFSITPATAA